MTRMERKRTKGSFSSVCFAVEWAERCSVGPKLLAILYSTLPFVYR